MTGFFFIFSFPFSLFSFFLKIVLSSLLSSPINKERSGAAADRYGQRRLRRKQQKNEPLFLKKSFHLSYLFFSPLFLSKLRIPKTLTQTSRSKKKKKNYLLDSNEFDSDLWVLDRRRSSDPYGSVTVWGLLRVWPVWFWWWFDADWCVWDFVRIWMIGTVLNVSRDWNFGIMLLFCNLIFAGWRIVALVDLVVKFHTTLLFCGFSVFCVVNCG